jgi:hypothetical protein
MIMEKQKIINEEIIGATKMMKKEEKERESKGKK